MKDRYPALLGKIAPYVFGALVLFGLIYYVKITDIELPTRQSAGIAEDSTVLSLEEKEATYPKAIEITGASGGYVNTNTVRIGDLVGEKVILVDFMTYSCINCIRTFPYVNAWYDAYKDQGLEIIGIHTPEFQFEKKIENVQAAMKKHGITFPIVLDNEYGTWQAYGNNYWPRKYLIDIDGYIVYDHIGEGAYEETEAVIQRLLAERAERLGLEMEKVGSVDVDGEIVNFQKLGSPETYFGLARNRGYGNGAAVFGVTSTFAGVRSDTLDTLIPNIIYLDGDWQFTDEYATPVSEGAKIFYRFEAEKVHLVMRSEEPVNATVRLDGNVVDDAAGESVVDGTVVISVDDLYRLIDLDRTESHIFEIEFEQPGVEVFAFTFG